MKRLLLALVLLAGYAYSLTPQEETDFIAAITSGNLPGIQAQLNRGFSPTYQFTLMGFRGYTPLSLSLLKDVPRFEYRNNTVQLKGVTPNAANQEQVYQLLASRVADKKELEIFSKELEKLKAAKEFDLYNALQRADLPAVKKAIVAGASLKAFEYLAGKHGFTPLQYAYGKDAQHKEIMGYLLSQGADSSVLDGSLLVEAVDGDVEMVHWLLAHGVRDKNNAALNEVTLLVQEAKDPAKKALFEQIKEILVNKK